VRTRNELDKNNAVEAIANSDALASVPVQTETSDSVDIDLAAQSKLKLNKIPYELRSLSHIEKAYEYLLAQDYKNIVFVVCGKSTELAFQYIKAHQGETNSSSFALVLIKPFLP